MTTKNDGRTEDQIIERIRRKIPAAAGRFLRLGVGDDAAILHPVGGTEWVVTCDQFLEDVHFLANVHPPEAIGYKALARATSDIAAMGARPRVFLWSAALPATRTGGWLDRLTAGMARAARQFGLRLAGGDTARSPLHGRVALSITVLGDVQAGLAVRRNAARPGDAIFVTGTLGAAQLGLEIVLRGMSRQKRWRHLLAPHLYPVPCIALGHWLAQHRLCSAMMDISDGLSTDLGRLCRASRSGARVYAAEVPGVTVPAALASKAIDAQTLALHGGEDYGLLFTVRPPAVSRIPRSFRGTAITRIGEIVPGRRILLISEGGRESRLAPQGWDHFRPQR